MGIYIKCFVYIVLKGGQSYLILWFSFTRYRIAQGIKLANNAIYFQFEGLIMARYQRVGLIGVPQHVIQRGNNRQRCFAREKDFIMYVAWLKEYSKKYGVAIHAWVFMTNHVHLLCTPTIDNRGVSKMMQSLGTKYVRYYNRYQNRTGTLWEGRFKSTLVCETSYLVTLYRYIELNPVRANMVDNPVSYKWSSYHTNALGKHSDLCTPHEVYLNLGRNPIVRLQNYRKLFHHEISSGQIAEIRKFTQREIVMGDDKFRNELEQKLQVKLKTELFG